MKAGDLEAAAPQSATALPDRLAEFDSNKDGKLQKSEMPERMQQRFDRMDTNGDGAVDGDEATAMRRRGPGRGGAREGGRRP